MITGLQLVSICVIQPNIPFPKQADSFDPNTPSRKQADTDLRSGV